MGKHIVEEVRDAVYRALLGDVTCWMSHAKRWAAHKHALAHSKRLGVVTAFGERSSSDLMEILCRVEGSLEGTRVRERLPAAGLVVHPLQGVLSLVPLHRHCHLDTNGQLVVRPDGCEW